MNSFRDDSQLLIAAHEAGHAVVHLLLGHHVIDVEIGTASGDGFTEQAYGATQFADLDTSVLADLVGTAAGEAAVLHHLKKQRHDDAEAVARTSAEHDRRNAYDIALHTTLPAGIDLAVASRLVALHWDAVERVAEALCKTPGGRLNSRQILAAANLGDTEYTWAALADFATAAAPGDDGLRRHLAGTDQRNETIHTGFLARLRTHGILYSPATATRRQINAEIYHRGMGEILAALDAASGGETQ